MLLLQSRGKTYASKSLESKVNLDDHCRLRDHVGEEITHLEDGDEEADCDEEWTEHLPLDGRGDILDKDTENDAAITENVDKTIELFK